MTRQIRLNDLIKPTKIEVQGLTEDSRYGKFIAEPLEPGFGITIGTSLRRILLSYLEGCAISSLKINDCMHEFSTISGIVEDVAEIILNLKEVVPFMEEKETGTLNIVAEGPCTVTAKDFTGDPNIQILNPAQHIATLTEGAKMNLTVTVKRGRGYITSDKNKVEGAPVGTIFIDSIFSPIRRINHIITNARVGQITDYDKLTMEVWTDGSIDARVAVAEAAHILNDQLSLFVGDGFVVEAEEPEIEDETPQFNENLYKRIDEIELSVRSANCLENADIKYLGELCVRTEAEMLRTKNFGRKSLNEIKEILIEMGVELGMKLEGFPNREELDIRAREMHSKKNN